MDLDELAESTAVVVPQRLGVTKGLEDRVGLGKGEGEGGRR